MSTFIGQKYLSFQIICKVYLWIDNNLQAKNSVVWVWIDSFFLVLIEKNIFNNQLET